MDGWGGGLCLAAPSPESAAVNEKEVGFGPLSNRPIDATCRDLVDDAGDKSETKEGEEGEGMGRGGAGAGAGAGPGTGQIKIDELYSRKRAKNQHSREVITPSSDVQNQQTKRWLISGR